MADSFKDYFIGEVKNPMIGSLDKWL